MPFEFVDQLPQTHTEVLVAVRLVVQQAPILFIRQALLKPAQDLDISEFSLGKPSLRHNAQALT